MKEKATKGYSLVEIIIVVAIMAVLIGISAMGIGSIIGFKSTGYAKKVISYMNEAKTDNASFDETELEIGYSLANGYSATLYQCVYDFGGDVTKSVADAAIVTQSTQVNYIGDKRLTVKVTVGGVEYDLKNYDITLGFDSGTGAFKPATVKQSGVSVVTRDDKKYISKIVVTQNSNTVTIICERLTGKFYIQ